MNTLGIPWTGGPDVPQWSPALARETMDKAGIAAAVASVAPGVYWGDEALAARLARDCNDYLADLVRDDPVHFGGFATLPLPDVDASLRELEYAYDTLGLDGVVLFTSQGDRYLGDSAYDPVFAELNRRDAVVFIHPNTMPPGADVPAIDIPYGVVEFVFDTTRCITNLLYSGTLERYPRIRYIVSHAGGTVPYLAWRIAGAGYLPQLRDRAPRDPMGQLQRLYYDTALSTSDFVFAALREFVPTSQILFGSDFPYISDALIATETAGLEQTAVFDATARSAIDRGNAEQLLPRFAALPAGHR